MAHLLTDTESGIWIEAVTVERDGVRVSKRTLRGGVSDGVDIVEIDNGELSFSVLPTRGMALWRGRFHGIELGWSSPVRGPVHPRHVDLHERGGLGWLRGFDEWTCRCGLESMGLPALDAIVDNTGARREVALPLHGRIGNTPARRVEFDVGTSPPFAIRVSGEVDETMLFGPALRLESSVRTQAGAAWLEIEDRVVNAGGSACEAELLYHVNQGPPLLEAGARIVAPIREMIQRSAGSVPQRSAGSVHPPAPLASLASLPSDAPLASLASLPSGAATNAVDPFVLAGPTPGHVEQVFFAELFADANGETLAMLRDAAGRRAQVLRWNVQALPCLTIWKQTGDARDGYVVGLEPGTGFPNPRPVERENGRVPRLQPGAVLESRLRIELLDDAAAVHAVEREISGIIAGRSAVLHPGPLARPRNSAG